MGGQEDVPVSADAEPVQFLWAALESFTQKELAAFWRFATGGSKLPLNNSELEFKITPLNSATPDQALAVAHTCFNQIELPMYSSTEICREKIIYAINNCSSMEL